MADSLSHLCMSLSNLPGFLKGFARIVRPAWRDCMPSWQWGLLSGLSFLTDWLFGPRCRVQVKLLYSKVWLIFEEFQILASFGPVYRIWVDIRCIHTYQPQSAMLLYRSPKKGSLANGSLQTAMRHSKTRSLFKQILLMPAASVCRSLQDKEFPKGMLWISSAGESFTKDSQCTVHGQEHCVTPEASWRKSMKQRQRISKDQNDQGFANGDEEHPQRILFSGRLFANYTSFPKKGACAYT